MGLKKEEEERGERRSRKERRKGTREREQQCILGNREEIRLFQESNPLCHINMTITTSHIHSPHTLLSISL